MKPTLLIITSTSCSACHKFRIDHLTNLKNKLASSGDRLIHGDILIDNIIPGESNWNSACIPPIINRKISMGFVPSFFLVNTVQLMNRDEGINILSMYAPKLNEQEDMEYIKKKLGNNTSITADLIYEWIIENHDLNGLTDYGPIKLIIKTENKEKRSYFHR